MNLEQSIPGGVGVFSLALSSDHTAHIVRRDGRLTFQPEFRPSQGDAKLGLITLTTGGAKLQAIETLHILPGYSQLGLDPLVATDPRIDKYQLEPTSNGRSEVIILRHGDVITAPHATDSVMCTCHASEIQVSSSAAEPDNVETTELKNGVADTTGEGVGNEMVPDDTVTEVPVTQPVTQPTKSQPSATPHLSKGGSLLVQETPTTDRTLGIAEYDAAPENESRHVETTPPLQIANAGTEAFSTARTGQSSGIASERPRRTKPSTDPNKLHVSSQVQANGQRSRKRPSPTALPDSEPSIKGHPSKRTKTEGSTEDTVSDTMLNSLLNDTNADPSRKTYSAKGKRRFPEPPETTPSKSSRSSQRSATGTTAEAYSGDPPRVATSNSAIHDKSAAVRFLRKHGGTLVASVEDKCNVLCVRDGALSKTMKVIQAIALGVPIVTDKWLLDSAKIDGLLDLSSYKPSVTKQEKEWQFDLGKVWGVAQMPFKSYTVYFTPALKKTYTNFREMDRVCQIVGANIVSKRTGKNDKMIVLAKEEDDLDADKMIADGQTCYHKDLLTTSILRGTLDLESDEFKIRAKPAAGPRRRGPRKST